MPSDTGAPHTIPYMVDGDPLADVADIMRTLAERVEERLGQRGTVAVAVAAASLGSVVVTFPIAFAAAPIVQVTTQNNTLMLATVESITATQMTVGVRHINATNVTGSYTVGWLALPA